MWERDQNVDTGWIGAGPDDDLDRRLAEEEEPFDLSRPHVMSALGPVLPAALGITLVHERFAPSQNHMTASKRDPSEQHVALAELEDLFAAGGRTIVDASTADRGRDVSALSWIAARSPVHLVLVTGYAGNKTPTRSRRDGTGRAVAELADSYTRDLTDGLAGSATRAGLILMDTAGRTIGAHEQTILRAVALTFGATSAPVVVRGGSAAITHEFLRALEEAGVDLHRVIISGSAASQTVPDLQSLLGVGAFLAFDRLLGDGLERAEAAADTIQTLVAAGFGDQILLTAGLAAPDGWRAHGGPGWVWLLERFSLMLMDAGVDARMVRGMLVDNPARALTIRAEE